MQTHLRHTAGLTALAALLPVCFLSGCGRISPLHPSTQPAVTKVMTIGTADSGGTMYPAGLALSEAFTAADDTMRVNVGASSGSRNNVEALMSGQFDMALVSGDVAWNAYHGTSSQGVASYPELRAIGAIYASTSNWMVTEKSGITSLAQLAGHSVSIGPEDSTTDFAARLALQAAGVEDQVTVINSSIGDGAGRVARGELTAVHGYAGCPIQGLDQMAISVPSRLLSYSGEELDSILKRYPYYYSTDIPAGTYEGQSEDVHTFGVKCLLCVDADADPDLVYRLARSLDEAAPRLAKENAFLRDLSSSDFRALGLTIPLHPGAEKYYKEKGYLP